MPVMDGYEAARRYRALARERRVPIVALTANAMKGDEERCLAAGMDAFVSKPFKPEELRAVLETWGGRESEGLVAVPSQSPKEAACQAPLIDVAALERVRDMARDGSQLLDRVVKTYVSASEEWIESIRQGFESGDLTRAGEGAHTLKSSSANLGAIKLSRIATEVERLTRAGDLVAARELWPNLARTHFETCALLEAHGSRLVAQATSAPAVSFGAR